MISAASGADLHPAWLRAAATRVCRWPTVVQAVAVLALVLATHPPLWSASALYWYPPGGLRFVLLVLLPVRLWPAVIGGEWLARLHTELGVDRDAVHVLLSVFPQAIGSAIAVFWLKRRWRMTDIAQPAGMTRLVLAIALNGVLGTLANLAFIFGTGWGVVESNLVNFIATSFVGATVVQVVFTPLAVLLLMGVRVRVHRQLLFELLVASSFLLALIALATIGRDDGGLRGDYFPLLLPVPTIYFAFRYGWRGAALSLFGITLLLAFGRIQPLVEPGSIARDLLLLDLTGAASLILGSAVDALRGSREALSARSLDLDAMNRELGELSVQLRQAARRNLELEEAQLKRIAGELHDELGQSLTAIQTRLKLVEGRLQEAGMNDTTVAMQDIITGMRRTIRGLMDSLRPAALDQFGLVRAIREGPIAELLEGAGLEFRLRIIDPHGAIGSLDDDTANAIYRIVQEAATNTVRHAGASRLDARVRIGRKSGDLLVVVDLRDDGVGLPGSIRHGARGLQGMRDRVTALGGSLLVSDSGAGTRVHAILPLAA